MSGATLHIKVTAPTARGLVWLLIFIGFILATVAVQSCTILEVDVARYYLTETYYFGFFSMQSPTSNGCMDYPNDVGPPPPAHRAASAMGVIAATFSGIVWLTLLSMVCFKAPTKHCWKICNVMLGISSIAESFQFIFFADPVCKEVDHKCSIGRGGNVAVASTVFLLLATVLMCRMAPPKEPAFLVDLSDVFQTSSENDDDNKEPKTTNIMGFVITKQPKQSNNDGSTSSGTKDDVEKGVVVANNEAIECGEDEDKK